MGVLCVDYISGVHLVIYSITGDRRGVSFHKVSTTGRNWVWRVTAGGCRGRAQGTIIFIHIHLHDMSHEL